MSSRFDELLPFYVNGSVSPEEREWFDAYLVEHPDAQKEVDWYRALQRTLRDAAANVPDMVGWKRTQSLIRADGRRWLDRIAAWFDSIGMKPVPVLVLVAIIAVQGLWIAGTYTMPDETSGLRAPHITPATEGPLLVINFASDARESEIREALTAARGRIVDGPSQLGDYFVRVPPGAEAAAAQALRANGIVRSVAVLPGTKPQQ